MLFHISVAAHDPQNVARVIAELWGGEAFPFPPVSDNGWIVLAGDDRRTALEIYPIDVVLREAEGDADAYGEASGAAALTATHAAIGTRLSQEQVMAIAAREGWPAKYRCRGGMFGVIEMWIEGRQMVEVLTAEMQAAAVDWRLVVYGGALHAFHHPPVDHAVVSGVGHHPRHAQRAWRDIVNLLAECLPVSE